MQVRSREQILRELDASLFSYGCWGHEEVLKRERLRRELERVGQ